MSDALRVSRRQSVSSQPTVTFIPIVAKRKTSKLKVMDDRESLVSLNGTHVSYIGHDCEDIPDFLGDTYGQLAKRLDLSFNQLR